MPFSGVLLTISEHCLGPVLEHEYRKKKRKVEALWIPLSSESFDVNLQSRSVSWDSEWSKHNLSGICNTPSNSPESFACCLVFRFPRPTASGEVLGTPEADVTPPSPPPQCFVSYVSCIVTYCQPVTDWVCFLKLSELKAQISFQSDWRSCCHREISVVPSWSAHLWKVKLRH